MPRDTLTEQNILCLSILLPWTRACLPGENGEPPAKRIETRSWSTSYRGPLLIHAGLNDSGVCARKRTQHGSPADRLYHAGLAACRVAGFPTDHHYWTQVAANTCGCIIAVAELVACQQITAWTPGGSVRLICCGSLISFTRQEYLLGDYTPGRYGWVLANVQPLTEPVYYKGRQGLFKVPLDAVRHALPAEWAAKLAGTEARPTGEAADAA